MIEIFASDGAQSFVVTKTDLLGGKSYSLSQLREKLPSMVRARRPSAAPSNCLTGKP
jgi:hypothetical protein